MKLRDKVVVVTGSGGGIGAAFARRFTADGAKVVVTDIDFAAVQRVSTRSGQWVSPRHHRGSHGQAVADLARHSYGEIDIWFSNAGYAGHVSRVSFRTTTSGTSAGGCT